jgi:hypothetical protein
MMRLDLHIGELVLHGVDAGDRERLAEDIERELARRLAEGGLPAALAAGGSVHLDGADLALPAGSPPGEVAAAIAREAHGQLRDRWAAPERPGPAPAAPAPGPDVTSPGRTP